MSKMHLRLTFRWIIQNVAPLKQHIFLIRENWSILLLLHRKKFPCFLTLSQHFTVSGKKHDILRNRYEKYALIKNLFMLACLYRVMDAHGKFVEHKECVREARGAAESNSSFLSAFQTS